MITDLLTPEFLKENLHDKLNDPYKDTILKGYYFLNPRNKGVFGEKLLVKFFEKQGINAVKQSNLKTTKTLKKDAGWDILIGDIKTEVKISMSGINRFHLNHLSINKNVDRFIGIFVNPLDLDKTRIIWFTKNDLINTVKNDEKIFLYQQGGKKIKNDDYKLSSSKKLLQASWVKDITTWQ